MAAASSVLPIPSGQPLAGRTAMVTGAAGGIGAALAAGFLERGANVVLADVDAAGNAAVAEAADPHGDRTEAVTLDVADAASAGSAFARAAARWGGIDILVNNAAVTRPGSLWDVSPDEWDRVLAVNLKGVFLMSRLAGAHMRGRGYGRIVNIASLAGQMARPSGVHYAAAKGGVLALTRVFAAELAGDGVTVNAVAPAIVDTPMLQMLSPERVAQLTAAIPARRVCRPEEVTALVCFLASAEAGYVTGATYDINGGMLMR